MAAVDEAEYSPIDMSDPENKHTYLVGAVVARCNELERWCRDIAAFYLNLALGTSMPWDSFLIGLARSVRDSQFVVESVAALHAPQPYWLDRARHLMKAAAKDIEQRNDLVHRERLQLTVNDGHGSQTGMAYAKSRRSNEIEFDTGQLADLADLAERLHSDIAEAMEVLKLLLLDQDVLRGVPVDSSGNPLRDAAGQIPRYEGPYPFPTVEDREAAHRALFGAGQPAPRG